MRGAWGYLVRRQPYGGVVLNDLQRAAEANQIAMGGKCMHVVGGQMGVELQLRAREKGALLHWGRG